MPNSLWPHGLQYARLTNSRTLCKLMSIELVMPSSHLILCRPLVLLPSMFPSIRVLSSESVLHIRWPKYWRFSFSISPSSEYSGLISYRMDWLDFLAVQGTLERILQHHSSKASILYCSENITQNVGKNGPGNRGHIEEKGTVSSKGSLRKVAGIQQATNQI